MSHNSRRLAAAPLWLAFAATVPLAAGSARANPLEVEIGRIGEVTAADAGPTTPPLPGNVVGSTPVLDPRYVTQGPEVEGAFCKQFGFEFRARNLPAPLSMPVEVRLDHPLWTLPDGRTSTREVNGSGIDSDHWTYSGYTLEESWSLVPGTWTFSVMAGGAVLATASFNVTVEPGQHMPEGGCAAPTS